MYTKYIILFYKGLTKIQIHPEFFGEGEDFK